MVPPATQAVVRRSRTVASPFCCIKEERCCLLCYEQDFNFCHRRYVAEKVATLVDWDVKINHLTGRWKGELVCGAWFRPRRNAV